MRLIELFPLASSVAIAVFLLVSTPKVEAQDCETSEPLEEGIAAPCDGVLWPRIWTLKAVECVEIDLPAANEKHARCLDQVVAGDKAFNALDVECARRIKELEQIARNAANIEPRSVWNSPYLWIGLGLIGGFSVARAFD